ncbi:MAG: 6-phosphogluconolactonase [Gammaproteobacteria bacterium]|nr:MAG: 6-phosphogluconolactonase [Gammaproteobacteria bacterium]
MMQSVRWSRFPDADAVAAEAVWRILQIAKASIDDHGAFRIVLAGGSTPRKAYQLLSTCEVDWSNWHLYLGDERCLPVGHAERNSSMIHAAWLEQGQVPPTQVHWIPAESGSLQGADIYENVVREAIPFDLVLLGMGEDGHTASLFPGHKQDPERLVVSVTGAPKPPPDRVSLNYVGLAETRNMLVLVTGSGKRPAVARWRAGESLPVARLECAAGVDVLLDEGAWHN